MLARPWRVRRLPAAAHGALGRSAAAALILLAGIGAGCAGRGEVQAGPARRPAEATLKVVNRTGADVQITAAGRSLGEVPAGSEQYFVGLTPGTLDLRGRSVDGELSFRRDLLTLDAGETFTWVLREGEASSRGIPAGAATPGSIVVENGTDGDVQILLDGQLLGTAPASRTQRFEGVAAGAHRLEARSPETTFPQEFPVLDPGETFTWRLRGPGPVSVRGILPAPGTGRLRVENPNPEDVLVKVNGVSLGEVAARNTRIFDNLAADRVRLSAESRDGMTVYEGPEIPIEAGGVAVWRLGGGYPAEIAGGAPAPTAGRRPPAPPSLPDADAGRDTMPSASGSERLPPVPSDEAPPPLLPPSEPAAAGDESAPPLSDESAGKVFVVENHTTQDLEILFDGESAGAVGAGMTRRFTELPGLRFTPSATSANGARRFPHPPVDLSRQDSFSWIIEP